jgi:ABC-type nitrate/sulfonate/bicarbonate transport system ATPase subunit
MSLSFHQRFKQEAYTIIQIHKERIILFVTYNIDEAAVLGNMIVVLSPKFVGIRKECTVSLPRPSDHPIVDSNTRSTREESGELYFDHKTVEDGKIEITKIFH